MAWVVHSLCQVCMQNDHSFTDGHMHPWELCAMHLKIITRKGDRMNKPRKCGIHKEAFYLLVLNQGRPEYSHLEHKN